MTTMNAKRSFVNPFIPLEKGWSEMKTKLDRLEQVMEKGGLEKGEKMFSPAEYTAIYALCFNMSTQSGPYNWASELWERREATVKEYLKTKVLPILQVTSSGGDCNELLEKLVKQWTNYQYYNKWVQKIFKHLDRYFAKHKFLPSLLQSGINAFRTCVFEPIQTQATQAVLELVEKGRDGEINVDYALLTRVVEMIQAMDGPKLQLYQTVLEEPLLEATRAYFAKKRSEWLVNMHLFDYLNKMMDEVELETKRAEKYLASAETTSTKLLTLVKEIMSPEQMKEHVVTEEQMAADLAALAEAPEEQTRPRRRLPMKAYERAASMHVHAPPANSQQLRESFRQPLRSFAAARVPDVALPNMTTKVTANPAGVLGLSVLQKAAAQHVFIKLGVKKTGVKGVDAIFRRVHLKHHLGANENMYNVLKLYAVQTFTGEDALAQSTSGYCVHLVYLDATGDDVMIGSAEELVDALQAHYGKGFIKIMANVTPFDEKVSVTGGVAREERSFLGRTLSAIFAPVVKLLAAMYFLARSLIQYKKHETPDPVSVQAVPAVETAIAGLSAPVGTSVPTNWRTHLRPFIHGRHTCDGCSISPIIGQRFHALNAFDFDLCSECYVYDGYTDNNLEFEPTELERDQAFQEEWYQGRGLGANFGRRKHFRRSRFQHSGQRHRCLGQGFSTGPGAASLYAEEAESSIKHFNEMLRGVKEKECKEGAKKTVEMSMAAKAAPLFAASNQRNDKSSYGMSKLKAAVNRELTVAFQNGSKSRPVNKSSVGMGKLKTRKSIGEPALQMVVKALTTVAPPSSTQTGSDELSLGMKKLKEAVWHDSTVATKSIGKAALMEETFTSQQTPPSSPPSATSDLSFKDDAEGNGETAGYIGATLDKFAAAIDDFNKEFERGVAMDAKTSEGEDLWSGSTSDDEELSQGSWVVEEEHFAMNQGMARAARVVGSALFESDVIQSQTNSAMSEPVESCLVHSAM
ncbi:hypothetical protein MPSEU_000117900 [Mayamaea pseudoterrestris]|nr:hypothetical protein MPSEU_000117900 [Mayamaea pseudoterrestris]